SDGLTADLSACLLADRFDGLLPGLFVGLLADRFDGLLPGLSDGLFAGLPVGDVLFTALFATKTASKTKPRLLSEAL
ncbi:MAG: hypothetical protein K2O97_10755, partial [Acetatifactor sp.]|nr:hypothetical protein [Acetatifactor sp.]